VLYLLRPFPLTWGEESLQKLQAFLKRLERVEPYFAGHIRRACFYALNFGKRIALPERELRQLYV
jgi:HD-GYP domain-containing protein (c-di-GMP phosphodiesterase class II)